MKTAFFSCKGMLLPETTKKLDSELDLRYGSCAMSEEELLTALQGVDLHFWGGEEIYTPRIARALNQNFKSFFIGIDPHFFCPKEAWDILAERNISIIPTGGGEKAVVRSTFDILYNDMLVSSRVARQFDWPLWEPGSIREYLREVGFGVIGSGKIAKLLLDEAFLDFKNVYYWGRTKKENLEKLKIPYERYLKRAFSRARIISINLAPVPDLIRYEHLSRIPKNSILINSSRAATIKARSLRRFLRERPDVLYITDVFYVEGKAYEELKFAQGGINKVYRDIIDCPNVIFTEHRFASRHPEIATAEYSENLLRILREQGIIT